MTLEYAAQWSVHGILLPYFPLKNMECECLEDEDEKARRHNSNLEIEKHNNRIKHVHQKAFLQSLGEISSSESAQLGGEGKEFEYHGFTAPSLDKNLDGHNIGSTFTMNLAIDFSANNGCKDTSLVWPFTSFFCETKSYAPLHKGDASGYMSQLAEMSKGWVDKIARDCTGNNTTPELSFYLSCLGLKTGRKECWPGMCQYGELKEGGHMQDEFLKFKGYLAKIAENEKDVELLFQELSDIHGNHGRWERDHKMIYQFRGEDYFFTHLGLLGKDLKWTGVSTVPSAEGISMCLGSFVVRDLVFIDASKSTD